MQFNSQSKWHRFLAKWLIRFKLIREYPLELTEVNHSVAASLPLQFEIKIPSGHGEFTIVDAEISVDKESDLIVADFMCHFKVQVAGTLLYDTYLSLILDGKVAYNKQSAVIKPAAVRIRAMRLLSDDRSMIKDTRKLITDMLPEPMKTLFITTMISTDAISNRFGINDMIRYLSIYLGGSKQRILDYHRQDIENNILSYIDSGALNYQLDPLIFEEQLFADYGQDISIKQGQLYFLFHV